MDYEFQKLLDDLESSETQYVFEDKLDTVISNSDTLDRCRDLKDFLHFHKKHNPTPQQQNLINVNFDEIFKNELEKKNYDVSSSTSTDDFPEKFNPYSIRMTRILGPKSNKSNKSNKRKRKIDGGKSKRRRKRRGTKIRKSRMKNRKYPTIV
jgi:hypothetical protein